MPGAPVEAGGGHLDEHLVVTHGRAGDVGETQDVGVAVAVLDDRLHGGRVVLVVVWAVLLVVDMVSLSGSFVLSTVTVTYLVRNCYGRPRDV